MDNNQLWKTADTKAINKLFDHYNYDGVAMNQDLTALARHEKSRTFARSTTPLWLGMSLFSAYNLTRFSVLSKSG